MVYDAIILTELTRYGVEDANIVKWVGREVIAKDRNERGNQGIKKVAPQKGINHRT